MKIKNTLKFAALFTVLSTSAVLAAPITSSSTWLLSNGPVKERGVTVFNDGVRTTIDFENDGAEVFLDWDGSSNARIYGQAYDDFTDELIAIDYYVSGIGIEGDFARVVTAGTGSGFIGSKTDLNTEMSKTSGFSFGLSGLSTDTLKADGWLTDGGDWHFAGTPVEPGSVPAPGGLLLIAAGLFGLYFRRRPKNA